ncbi:DUF1015 family protein [Nonomuraea dietziae]|uniref:DUF1015 family protein n=1 Tax=Nonomuraea dietziae TaxID=65515 RepID=UPI0031D8E5BF
MEAVTGDGVRHRLWAVTDPDEIELINADLRHRQALIADGHHRYATYRMLQRKEHAARGSGGPWDFGLSLLVDSTAYPPDLKAIHRVLPSLPLSEAATRAKGSWQVRDFDSLEAGLEALETTAEPAFLLAGEDGGTSPPPHRPRPAAAGPRHAHGPVGAMERAQHLGAGRVRAAQGVGDAGRRAECPHRAPRPQGGGTAGGPHGRDGGDPEAVGGGGRAGGGGGGGTRAPQVHLLRPQTPHRPGPAHLRLACVRPSGTRRAGRASRAALHPGHVAWRHGGGLSSLAQTAGAARLGARPSPRLSAISAPRSARRSGPLGQVGDLGLSVSRPPALRWRRGGRARAVR